MNLDFNVLVFLTGFVFSLPIIGYLFRFSIPISIFFLLAGTFMIAIFLATDGIILDSFAFLDGDSTITYYDVMSRSFEQSIFTNTQDIQAEELSTSSSLLFGDTINCLELNLRKTGSPPLSTLIRYGVYDSTGAEKYLIGTMNVTILTTSSTPYKLCNFTDNYTLITGDRIGARYSAGNSTNAIVMQFDANNPFDSTITRQSRFSVLTGLWTSFTANDFMGTISLESSTGEQIIQEDKVMDFTFTGENFQLKVIMIFI